MSVDRGNGGSVLRGVLHGISINNKGKLIWSESFQSLQTFVKEVLNLSNGVWSCPGGESKKYKAEDIDMRWYPTTKSITLNGKAKDEIKEKLLSIVAIQDKFKSLERDINNLKNAHVATASLSSEDVERLKRENFSLNEDKKALMERVNILTRKVKNLEQEKASLITTHKILQEEEIRKEITSNGFEALTIEDTVLGESSGNNGDCDLDSKLTTENRVKGPMSGNCGVQQDGNPPSVDGKNERINNQQKDRRTVVVLGDFIVTYHVQGQKLSSKEYPVEVRLILTGESEIPDCATLELDMMEEFYRLPRKVQWRGGTQKSSFNYLLLDPRVTLDLPQRSKSLSPIESFRSFILSIFYVGKGKRSRPYAHLHDAINYAAFKELHSKSKPNKKLDHIWDIWGDELGVITLHLFQSAIPVEAFTREACMVEALGLSQLTNQKGGEYYGLCSSLLIPQKQKLGIFFLHNAFQIFLLEGERQICEDDLYTTDMPEKQRPSVPTMSVENEKPKSNIQQKPTSFQYNGVDVYASDICTLEPRTMVNDTIINILFNEINCQFPIVNSFFYTVLRGDQGAYLKLVERMEKAEQFFKADVLTKEYIIIPINRSLHWLLIVITPWHILVMDSLTQDLSNRKTEISYIYRYLEYLCTKSGISKKHHKFTYHALKVPQQPSSSNNCGIYLSMFTNNFFKNLQKYEESADEFLNCEHPWFTDEEAEEKRNNLKGHLINKFRQQSGPK